MQSIWLWHHSNLTLFYQFLNNFLNIIKCIDRWLFGYIAALKYNSLNHLDVQGSIRLGVGGGIFWYQVQNFQQTTSFSALILYWNHYQIQTDVSKIHTKTIRKLRPNSDPISLFLLWIPNYKELHTQCIYDYVFFCVNSSNNASKKPNRRWRLWLVVAGNNENQIKSTKN